jgi:hypothetical protein
VADQESTRRHLCDRSQRVDGENVTTKRLGCEELLFVTHDARDLDRVVKVVGTRTPVVQVRGGGESRHALHPFVLGRDGQGERATKTETRE